MLVLIMFDFGFVGTEEESPADVAIGSGNQRYRLRSLPWSKLDFFLEEC